VTSTEQPAGPLARGTIAPDWCKNVIWVHVILLVFTGLISLRGTSRILEAGNGIALLAAFLLWSKVIVGLTADAGLLRRSPRGFKLAVISALLAILGGLFALFNTDIGAGVDPDSWAYQNRSGIRVFLFGFGILWNILYLVAARRLVPIAPRVEPQPVTPS
jgi:hypothetical protein